MQRGLSFGKRGPESVIALSDIPTYRDFVTKDKDASEIAAKVQKKPKPFSYSPYVDKIRLFRGDITRLQVDAIVNAANTSLWAGGGVCGAIHHAAGSELEDECTKIGHCATGQTVITKGYKLPAKHVLHSVGPTRTDDKALASCYATCLQRCIENELRSVAFCCISTGIYGFPNDRACNVALTTVRKWLDEDEDRAAKIDAIIFCTFLAEDYKLYLSNIPLIFPLDPAAVAAPARAAPAAPGPKSPSVTETTEMDEKKSPVINSPSAPHSPSPPAAEAEADESKPSSSPVASPSATPAPAASSASAAPTEESASSSSSSSSSTAAPMQVESDKA